MSAEISLSGMASGNLVKRSTIVNRYVKPCDAGKGPIMSTCKMSNRLSGIGRGVNGATTCCDTFARWHAMHVRVQ